MSITERERLEQLELIAAANRQMAERAKAPGWYHWALGALMGGLAAILDAPVTWMLAYYVVFGVGIALLVRAYRKHTGMWIPGYRAGRTRWVAFSGAALIAAIMLGSVWVRRELGFEGAGIVAGVLVAALVTAKGYIWEKAYRRDLGVD
jgi:branched-subunit amino acid transport protein